MKLPQVNLRYLINGRYRTFALKKNRAAPHRVQPCFLKKLCLFLMTSAKQSGNRRRLGMGIDQNQRNNQCIDTQ
jgi:hypothetical protein